MKVRTGDTVKIREWDDMAAEYGVEHGIIIPTGSLLCFDDSMRKFCGNEYTVDRVDESDGSFTISGDDFWWFNSAMIEGVEPTITDRCAGMYGQTPKIQIGRFSICRQCDGKLWIETAEGEGGEFDESGVEAAIAQYYADNF